MSEDRLEIVLWQSYWDIKIELEDAQNEIKKLRAALQWLLNDLEDYPASARPLAAYDNARAALGEKE